MDKDVLNWNRDAAQLQHFQFGHLRLNDLFEKDTAPFIRINAATSERVQQSSSSICVSSFFVLDAKDMIPLLSSYSYLFIACRTFHILNKP